MKRCFNSCRKLKKVLSEVPSGVTNIKECFYGCKKLTTITLLCNYAGKKNVDNAFGFCSGLGKKSIKVPKGQLQAYQDDADNMGITDPEKFYEAE